MAFEIQNPNYSGETLREAAVAVISCHGSTGNDITVFCKEVETSDKDDKKG